MKFKTQHVRVLGKAGFNLHREGNVTFKTAQAGKQVTDTPYDVIEHESVAAAKSLLGGFTCAGSH